MVHGVEQRGESSQDELAGADAAEPALARLWQMRRPLLLGTSSVLVALGLWEALSAAGIVPAFYVSAPSQILATLGTMLLDGSLGKHAGVSASEFAIGYALAVAVGIPLGMGIGWYRRFAALMDPFVAFFYVTPRITLIGLIVVWLGIGINAKAALVFLGAVFPLLISTTSGLRSLDPALVKCARAFGASDWQFFRTIALPATVPFIVTGLRLAVGRGLIGLVVGELYIASAGIGYLIAAGGQTFQADLVFVGIFIIGATALVLMRLIGMVEEKYSSWRPQSH
ncbi:MAG: ABC transporter permease [Chloroflexi bacterium]|nr:ABC transporter permease [Chloroflexota bacterium]